VFDFYEGPGHWGLCRKDTREARIRNFGKWPPTSRPNAAFRQFTPIADSSRKIPMIDAMRSR